ncbi:MarR family transcriptional regulator [Planctomycetota bacterium]|nr:MarR family transcriptional regulator [Planctomycetota bacterium]
MMDANQPTHTDSQPQKADQQAAAIRAFIDSVITTFQRLRSVGEQLHGNTGITPAMRLIMRTIDEMGAMTVPQIAREKPVSRQVVQKQVKSLLDKGYVEQKPNPAHNTSQLIDLTELGREELKEMNRREMTIFKHVETAIDVPNMLASVQTIEAIERHLASRDWTEYLNALEAGIDPEKPDAHRK